MSILHDPRPCISRVVCSHSVHSELGSLNFNTSFCVDAEQINWVDLLPYMHELSIPGKAARTSTIRLLHSKDISLLMCLFLHSFKGVEPECLYSSGVQDISWSRGSSYYWGRFYCQQILLQEPKHYESPRHAIELQASCLENPERERGLPDEKFA